jgi:hypothetical protein
MVMRFDQSHISNGASVHEASNWASSGQATPYIVGVNPAYDCDICFHWRLILENRLEKQEWHT